jgi:hypothetical protein
MQHILQVHIKQTIAKDCLSENIPQNEESCGKSESRLRRRRRKRREKRRRATL